MKLLKILAGGVLFSIILLIHEAGHWVEMERHNIPIKEVSLGMNLGLPLPNYTFHLTEFPGITFALNILPIGAYVQPTEEGGRMEKLLPKTDQALIVGAGVWANVLTGLVFGIIATSKEKRLSIRRKKKRTMILLWLLLITYVGKQIFCTYFIGVLWLTLVVIMCMWMLLKRKKKFKKKSEGKDTKRLMKLARMPTSEVIFTKKVFRFGEIICYTLAFANILPIPPMDGGQMAILVLTGFCSPATVTAFTFVGCVIFMGMLLTTAIKKIF